MIDSRFFDSLGPLRLGDLATLTGSDLADPDQGGLLVASVAPLGRAGRDSVAFLADKKRLPELHETHAGACFLTSELAAEAPKGCVALITAKPQYAWVLAANALHRPVEGDGSAAFIHPTARIEKGARLGQGVVIGAGAAIGAGTVLEPHVVVGPGVSIGRDGYIGSHSNIVFALLGDRVRTASGVRIGQGGFGVTGGPKGPVDIPQLGRVIIQDGVTVGANCCIDRGAWEDTVIGENTKLDNLVHIAHNVRIGRACLIAGQVGIAGSSVIGDGVAFGGQAGVADHVTIGDGASVGASGGVLKNIPAGEVWSGWPARPVKQWLRETAALSRLAKRGGAKGQDR